MGNLQGNYIGLAGELRVMSELLLRGHNPAKSYLENGADLILENGLRIEVKSKHKQTIKDHDIYQFSLRGGHRKQNQNLDHCDFLICWCIDDDCFYIIPTSSITTEASAICIFNHSSKRQWTKYLSYKENWELLQRR